MAEVEGFEIEGVSLDFKRRVSRMTTAEMRTSETQWLSRIESGGVPAERLQGAKMQLMYLRDQIEKRRKVGSLGRTLRR
jgi:hypothetical protein